MATKSFAQQQAEKSADIKRKIFDYLENHQDFAGMTKTAIAKKIASDVGVSQSSATKYYNEWIASEALEVVDESISDSNIIYQDQQKKIEELTATVNQLTNLILTLQTNNPQPTQTTQSTDEICLISNVYGTVDVEFPSWSFRASKMGQKITITKAQFNELVNTHRNYFDMQYLLLDVKHMDIAKDNMLPVYDPTSSSMIHYSDLDKIGKMSDNELRIYYESLSDPMKLRFTQYFLNRCYEYDPDYYTVNKMNLLKVLTESKLFDNLIYSATARNMN